MQTCPLCEHACPGSHFHGLEDPSANHTCGREHACVDPATKLQRKCGNSGSCGITAELAQVETRTFRGKLQNFEYTALTRQVRTPVAAATDFQVQWCSALRSTTPDAQHQIRLNKTVKLRAWKTP